MTLAEEKMSEGIRGVIDCSKFGSFENLLLVDNFVRRFALKLKAKELGGLGLQRSLAVAKMEKKVRCCG